MLLISSLFDLPVSKVLLVSVDSGGSKEHENECLGFIFMIVTFV